MTYTDIAILLNDVIAGTLCINNGVPRFVICGDEGMMKKGSVNSVSIAKDGGLHSFGHVQQPQFPVHRSGNTTKFIKLDVSEAAGKRVGSFAEPVNDSLAGLSSRKDGGALVVSTIPRSRKRTDDHVEKEENEDSESQNFEWVKPEIHLNCVDMLGMDTAKDSSMAPSLTMGIDAGSELTDHLTDFVFSSSLPDNGNVKQEYTNYLETLGNGDHLTRINSFSETPVSWGSSLQLSHPLDNTSTPHILIQPHIAHYHTESGSTLSAPLTDKIEVHNSDPIGAGSSIFASSSQHSSSLFDTNEIKPNVSTLKIVQYPTSNFVDDAIILNNYTTATSSFAPVNSQQVNSISLSNKPVADSATFSVNDMGSDLNLSQLPNFLGLDAYSPANAPAKEIPLSLGNNTALNLLDTIGESPVVQHIDHGNQISSESKTNEDIRLDSADTKQNLNVTTISISNDDEFATKILVDTHEGQQQMYVINAADLNQLQNATYDSNVSHLYVVNNPQEHSEESTGTKQCILSSEPVISQANNILAQDQNVTQLQGGTTLITPAELPGFVLMPLAENTTKTVHPLPAQKIESDDKRPPKKLLMCPEPGCQKTFKKASKLKVHQMMHTGERPFKCTLMGCEWAFTTSNKLKRHLESHEGRKDYVCDKPGCGHRFTTIYNLNTHRRLHERPCTEVCPQEGCNQSFPTKRQLDMHLRNIHAVEEHTFKCPEPGCEKVFFSSGCMGSHMKVHRQNMEDLRCKHPGCGKQFTKLCRLRQHQQLHTGEKPFVCTYQGCTWAFATASKLKRHQTKHTGYRKWTCSICQKQFQRSEHLKGHLITHSGDKPFVCPVSGCGNTFAAKSSLYVHLKKHDESGKTIVYHCPMENCNNFYANKASLRQHILVKHCSLPNKGSVNGSQIMSSWLSLLASGEDSYNEEATHQPPAAATQDALLATDFLTGGVVDPTFLNPSNESLPSDANSSGSSTAATSASALLPPVTQPTPQQQPQHKQILLQGLQLMDEQEFLQQQERMSHVAVERGKKSQIMLENMHGSARTDPRSNDIMSQRALQRWQKQKEEEAAKLRARLDEQARPQQPLTMGVSGVPPSPSSSMTASGDYKSPVSNNVSLGGRGQQQYFVVSKSSGFGGPTVTSIKEISDLEIEGEGLTDMLDTDEGPDSFMTEFLVRDPDTGITYRQTQLLQDDPPNPNHGLLEDTDSMGGLDVNFVEDYLTFHPME